MTGDRFADLKRVLTAALEVPEDERSAFVARACAGDEELRAEVGELLDTFGTAPPILATGALGPRSPDPGGRMTPAAAALHAAGAGRGGVPERVGRYEILRVIGEGGMGVVYEAQQEKPQRKVALKVIRPGLAAARLLRRFEHESQVLGHLQHPGIAQIFEAGTAETAFGPQPFFAMEYIRGNTLGAWVRETGPSLKQRLELFALACDAVQHAHQKGVIHRDLKPGNILVDSSGQPKILDFGVARVTDADLQMTTMQTDTGQLVGTLPYMSPEQVAADSKELDTRSDVYALGVILYELLAEKLPYELSGRSVPEAARVIQEQDPTSLSSVSRAYRGDLETIVAKALEKEKNHRYQSAEQLAEDVRRYLRDEPIVARPPSTIYQIRKFAKRNKVLVGGVAAVFTALLLGLAVSVNLYQRAETKRVESEAVTEFLSDMLSSVDPEEKGKEVTVREVLDEAAKTIGETFADQPLVEASLRHTIGSAYVSVGEVEAAEPHLLEALALRREALGDEHVETLRAQAGYAGWTFWDGRLDESLARQREVLAVRRRALGDEHPDTVASMVTVAARLREQGHFDESTELLQEALEMQRRDLGESHDTTLKTQYALAMNYQRMGYTARADSVLRPVVEVRRRTLGVAHPNTLRSMRVLAGLCKTLGLLEESEVLYEEMLANWRTVYREDVSPASLLCEFAWLRRAQGRFADAESLLREAIADEDPKKERSILRTIRSLGLVVADQRRYAEAESLLVHVIERHEASGADRYVDILHCEHALAQVYADAGRHADAEEVFRRYWAKNRDRYGEDAPQTFHAKGDVAEECHARGKLEEAERLYSQIWEDGRRALGEDHKEVRRARGGLADVWVDTNRPQEALMTRRTLAEGDDADAKIAYAKLLLTCEPEELRDPREALRVAREANELSKNEDPEHLDALALAYHAAAEMARAVETQRQALALLPDGSPERSGFQERLTEYEAAATRSPPPGFRAN